MIELPEGLVLADQMNSVLKGKTVVRLTAASSPHKFAWFYGDPAQYPGLFAGKTLEEAYSYGGKLHVRFSGDCGLAFFDGVCPRYYPDASGVPAKHQLTSEFDDGSYLVCTVQMYGGIYGYSGVLHSDFDEIARTKPSVFSDGFSFEYFKGLMAGALKPKHSAKAFLATEQRIPGLGNGTAQDILFNAGVSPKRDIATLSPPETERLFAAVKETLGEMTREGGRDTEKDLFGQPGGYRTRLSKNTYTEPCPRCGSPVRKETFLGGSVYYCPECQK